MELIQVFKVRLDEIKANTSVLSLAEKTYISGLKNKDYAEQKLKSYTFLRESLSEILKVPPEALCFKTSPHGRPYLPDYKVSFNLSHSGNYLALAISQTVDVGLDIQEKREYNPKLYETILNQNELSQLSKRSADLFFDLWTIKESGLKCLGLGVKYGFHNLEINLKSQTLTALKNAEFDFCFLTKNSLPSLQYKKVDLFENLASHLSWTPHSGEIKIHFVI